jgi:hypothetical protein
MGGLDWSGLPVVVEVLGISDVERLVRQLKVIKNHRPPKEDDTHATGNTEH